MARQSGVIKFTGKIGGLSFYKSKSYGFLAREGGNLDARRIATDPAFVRTRENASEFGNAVRAAKLLRNALRQVLPFASDGKLTPRLNGVMVAIKKYDTENVRGQRLPAAGLHHAEARALLEGFEFNNHTMLEKLLLCAFSTDPASGVIQLSGFQPAAHLVWPEGATHCEFTGVRILINFATEDFVTAFSEVVSFSQKDPSAHDVSLVSEVPPDREGLSLQLLLLQYKQELNGISYSLQSNRYNALTIVSVGEI